MKRFILLVSFLTGTSALAADLSACQFEDTTTQLGNGVIYKVGPSQESVYKRMIEKEEAYHQTGVWNDVGYRKIGQNKVCFKYEMVRTVYQDDGNTIVESAECFAYACNYF